MKTMKNHVIGGQSKIIFLVFAVFLNTVIYSQPAITGFSPQWGKAGSTVTISGSGFSTVPANNIVFFGGAKATVTAATSNTLTVIVPNGTTYLPLSVTVNKLTGKSKKPFAQTFDTCLVNQFSVHPKVDFATGLGPKFVSGADFDLDGKTDIVTNNIHGISLSILRNNSTINNIAFNDAQNIQFLSGGGGNISIGDLDGDGKLDIVIPAGANGHIVYRNISFPGNISFAAPQYQLPNNVIGRSLIEDMNGDGKPEIIIVGGADIAILPNTTVGSTITFSTPVIFPYGASSYSLTSEDIDNDNRTDIIISNYSDKEIWIVRNTSTPSTFSLSPPVKVSTGIYNPVGISSRDLDNDGKSDLAITNYTSDVTLMTTFRNISTLGNILFEPRQDWFATKGAWLNLISDVNGDARPDILTANYVSIATNVSVFFNNSNPAPYSFHYLMNSPTASMPQSVFACDLDGDGKQDLVSGNFGGNSISVLRNKSGVVPQMTLTTTPATCNQNNGTITAVATTGQPPYSYSIDGINFQTSGVFANLSAGTYTITIKDATVCGSAASAIVESTGGPSFTVTVTNTACSNNATITVNSSGGVMPHHFSIDGSAFQSSNIFSGVSPGQYTVFVKDANNCVAQAGATISPYNLDLEVTSTSPACGTGNGSIMASATGSFPPFSYSLNNGAFSSNSSFNNLQSGTYTLTVRDANNCLKDTAFFIGSGCLNVQPTITDATCGNSNGGIMLTVTNGTSPYEYSLDGINFTSLNQFSNLAEGSYIIYVRDAGGVSVSMPFVISNTNGPVLTYSSTNESCNGNDGSIVLNATGGTSPFLYNLNGGAYQTSSGFSGLRAGSYTFTVKDANGCVSSASILIELINDVFVTITTGNAICEGDTASIQSSSNGLSYLWSPTAGLSSNSILSPQAFPSQTTQYTLTAKKGICSAEASTNILVNPAPIAIVSSDTTICQGISFQLESSGGLLYHWNPSTYLDNADIQQPSFSGAPVGTYSYSVVITDANGCKSLIPGKITLQVKEPKVFGGNDTTVGVGEPFILQAKDVNSVGFTNFSWSPQIGLQNPNLPTTIGSLSSDTTYTITAQSPNGCMATDNISVNVLHSQGFYVPNVFSPNGDGVNDILRVKPAGIRTFKHFTVFNRYGNIVFRTNNSSIGWDGKYRGQLLSGAFVWIAEGVDGNNKAILNKGVIVIIR